MLGWELPPHNSGGLGVACYHLAKAMATSGVSIDFVLPYQADHPDTEWMTVHGVETSIEARQAPTLAYSSSFEAVRSVQRSYTQLVKRLIATSRPDVIHAHDWLTVEAGIEAKRLSGAPLIVHVHATEFDRCGADRGNPYIHEIEEMGLLMADRIIAVSAVTKAIIVQKYGIPAKKIEVAHNAFDPSQFDRDDYRYDASTYAYLQAMRDDGYKVVTVLTRLTVQKGLSHFLRAAARATERYDRLLFFIVGDGEQRDELLELSAELGIADRVIFTGFLRGKRWRDAYSFSDVFVMSSVSEPFGLTALEAAHHDNAIILTKQSGVGEVLSSVLRYDFWDIDKLADQMIAIAASPALDASLRHGAKREYVRLSWADVAATCRRAYDKTRSIEGVVA